MAAVAGCLQWSAYRFYPYPSFPLRKGYSNARKSKWHYWECGLEFALINFLKGEFLQSVLTINSNKSFLHPYTGGPGCHDTAVENHQPEGLLSYWSSRLLATFPCMVCSTAGQGRWSASSSVWTEHRCHWNGHSSGLPPKHPVCLFLLLASCFPFREVPTAHSMWLMSVFSKD